MSREWRQDVDKKAWGDGPWQTEPDKVQWVDEPTGFDCLIVRNHFGGLCGYVGVPETHPLFGVGYSQETDALRVALDRRMEEPVGDTMPAMLAALSGEARATPDLIFDVHGGLTFSDFYHEPDLSREAWTASGDNSTYEEWAEAQYARRICHVPEAGRPDRVWWFGFDCGHSQDFQPAMRKYGIDLGDVYRTIGYVRAECAGLASQLAVLS